MASERVRDRSEMDWADIRREFPVLWQNINGHPLVYLDSAASAQMPQSVIDRMVWYQSAEHSNVHRGVHTLSQRATEAYEETREKVRALLNAPDVRSCIFVRGVTEAINLVAHGWGRKFLEAGDEVIVSQLEHHANIVPWQMVCEEKGARLRVIPMNDAGELDQEAYRGLFNARTKFVAVGHVSNALGTVNPVAEMVAVAHEHGVPVLVDGAQAVPHMAVDVQALGADFYTFSSHKIFGPTGIGVLYGRRELLEKMQPYQGGGDMILTVSFEKTTYNELPHKFEAGTPAIVAGVGLGAAIDYVRSIGLERIEQREAWLLERATAALSDIPGVRILGTAREKASVISFEIEGVHPHDIGTLFDNEGVAIRAGHHCAQPLMQRLGVAATARASFAFYNNEEDIAALVAAIHTVKEVFGV